jgi:hypothetical protein
MYDCHCFFASLIGLRDVFALSPFPLLAEGKHDRMEGAVAKNFEEGKSHEQVREVGHHARKAAPFLLVLKAKR